MELDQARVKEIIAKTRAFYDTRAQGCALIKVKEIATLPSYGLPLNHYNFPNDVYRYLDDCATRYMLRMEQRAGLRDDTVPAVGPWYGIAEHTAFLGGKIDFESDTSWHHVEMAAADDFTNLSLDENNPVLKMVIGGIAYLRDKYSKYFVPMVRGASGALEMANALRGSELFYDFYEDPEGLEKLLDFCANALIWNYEKQLTASGDGYGGVVTGFGEWRPGRGLGHVSEDTTTMISVEQFEKFARPRTERVYRHFDEVFLHMHALSERCLASAAAMPNLRLMELSSDPNTDRAIEVWKRNRENLTKVIPVLCLTRQEIESNMELLKSQKTVVWYNATSLEDAQEMCKTFACELPVH
ncbi:MAG: uroporphyrinogen decarboxylase family protein [Ruthenibacterium sp.]